MNKDVKFMLRLMNSDACPDKSEYYCHICDRRVLCEERHDI